MMLKFVFPFLYSLALTVIAIPLIVWLGRKLKVEKVKRYGGIVVILVVIVSIVMNPDLEITMQILGILLGSFLILCFGYWDDLKNMSWQKQLFFQVLVALAAILFGVRSYFLANPWGGIINLDNPVIYLILFTVYYLFFMNSFNWMDGIDGFSGSLTLVALAAIFFLSFKPEVNQPATAILASIAAGSIIGFLIFNWKPAVIHAGTTGAWFFGFFLASLSIFAGAKVATVMIVSLVPLLDMLNVISERYFESSSIFLGGDDRHLHFRLLKLGLNETEIILLITALSSLIAIIALNISAPGKLAFIIIISSIYLMLAKLLRLKFKK